MNRLINIILLMLFIVVFGFTGIFCLRGALSPFLEGSQSTSWPSTNGLVTKSDVEVFHEFGMKRDRYRPVIEYSYQAGGHTYVSKRIRFGNTSSRRANGVAGELSATYHKGKEVSVFYNPQHPQEAILETGVQSSVYFPLIFGPLILLMVIFVGRLVFLELRTPGTVLKNSNTSGRGGWKIG